MHTKQFSNFRLFCEGLERKGATITSSRSRVPSATILTLETVESCTWSWWWWWCPSCSVDILERSSHAASQQNKCLKILWKPILLIKLCGFCYCCCRRHIVWIPPRTGQGLGESSVNISITLVWVVIKKFRDAVHFLAQFLYYAKRFTFNLLLFKQ